MKIVNMDNARISGCFVFFYLGYEISCSSIMNKNIVEVLIFDDEDNALKEVPNSIPHAMSIIDKVLENKSER